jgi:hypothetical protein
MAEGGADIEGSYEGHYPTDARMDNRKDTRETSREKFRVMLNDLTNGSYFELRREGNSRVGQYNISGMARNRRLEVLTYAMASGRSIVSVNDESLVAKTENPHDSQIEEPHVINKNREEAFDKTYAKELSSHLNIDGGTQVRSYDLANKTEDEQKVIKANAALCGWKINFELNNMLILKRQLLQTNAKSSA